MPLYPYPDARPNLENKVNERQLQETVRHLQQDVETLALQLNKSQQLALRFIQQLDDWIKEDHAVPREIKYNLRQLKHQLMVFKRLEKLSVNFEQVNAAFYHKLLSQSPSLTQLDLELCAYARMGLTKKEVAVMRGVTPDSVKRQYNRLRKRLKLAPAVDLHHFLSQLV